MTIGNMPKDRGTQLDLNKWYFCLEIRTRPYTMIKIFRPWIYIAFIKLEDHGEPGKIGGRPLKVKGWRRQFTFPFGLIIDLTK